MHVACLVWYAEYSTRFFYSPFSILLFHHSFTTFLLLHLLALHCITVTKICVSFTCKQFLAFWQLFCLMQGLGDGVYKYLQILVFF